MKITLKQYIRELAAQQVDNKSARKTGTLPEWPRTSWGEVDHNAVPEAIKASWKASSAVWRGKIRITAALNLLHELRGTPSSHAVREGTEYWYHRDYEELKSRFSES